MPPKGGLPAILVGGSLAGILDLTDALVFYGLRGVRPIRILQSIARGLLGAKAFEGGWGTAALGVGLHFVIALGAAAVYYAASRRLKFMRRRAVMSGLLYGVAVFLFMNGVVLPLSAAGKPAFSTITFLNGIAAHLFFVGLPISLAVRRYSK